MLIRPAVDADIDAMFEIRTSVRENHQSREELARMGITPETIEQMLATTFRAWIGVVDGHPVAFSMADGATATVFAMFVRPECEGRGLGRALMREAEHWLASRGCRDVWLLTGSEPGNRAPDFYQRLGWSNVGRQADGQLKFIKSLPGSDEPTSGPIDAQLHDTMLDYYNECAAEYDAVYKGEADTASPLGAAVFTSEARLLSGVVRRFARGRLLDLACGTGYWLPFYAAQCSTITCFDQSERMLDGCRTKAARLGIGARCEFVQGDFFDAEFSWGAYDCALVGFFLSHLSESQEPHLFETLRRVLAPSGLFLIMDSAFSDERSRVNAKVERQERRLKDGRRFDVFKRYCDRQDISSWGERYHTGVVLEHFGPAFYAVSGTFSR